MVCLLQRGAPRPWRLTEHCCQSRAGLSWSDLLLQDLDGLPGDMAGRAMQQHRYAGFENGDDDSDDDDDLGRAFDTVRTQQTRLPVSVTPGSISVLQTWWLVVS